jgi:hypothetical protein
VKVKQKLLFKAMSYKMEPFEFVQLQRLLTQVSRIETDQSSGELRNFLQNMRQRGDRQNSLVETVLEDLEQCFLLQQAEIVITKAQFLDVELDCIDDDFKFYHVTHTLEEAIKSVLTIKLFLFENNRDDFLEFCRLVDR